MTNNSFVPSLSASKAEAQATLFRALADPTRLRILSLLTRHAGTVCVEEICVNFACEQPTISHHLGVLRHAGLVRFHKQGLRSYYYVCPEVVTHAVQALAPLLAPSRS